MTKNKQFLKLVIHSDKRYFFKNIKNYTVKIYKNSFNFHLKLTFYNFEHKAFEK